MLHHLLFTPNVNQLLFECLTFRDIVQVHRVDRHCSQHLFSQLERITCDGKECSNVVQHHSFLKLKVLHIQATKKRPPVGSKCILSAKQFPVLRELSFRDVWKPKTWYVWTPGLQLRSLRVFYDQSSIQFPELNTSRLERLQIDSYQQVLLTNVDCFPHLREFTLCSARWNLHLYKLSSSQFPVLEGLHIKEEEGGDADHTLEICIPSLRRLYIGPGNELRVLELEHSTSLEELYLLSDVLELTLNDQDRHALSFPVLQRLSLTPSRWQQWQTLLGKIRNTLPLLTHFLIEYRE